MGANYYTLLFMNTFFFRTNLEFYEILYLRPFESPPKPPKQPHQPHAIRSFRRLGEGLQGLRLRHDQGPPGIRSRDQSGTPSSSSYGLVGWLVGWGAGWRLVFGWGAWGARFLLGVLVWLIWLVCSVACFYLDAHFLPSLELQVVNFCGWSQSGTLRLRGPSFRGYKSSSLAGFIKLEALETIRKHRFFLVFFVSFWGRRCFFYLQSFPSKPARKDFIGRDALAANPTPVGWT